MKLKSIFDVTVAGNTVLLWLIAIGIFAATLVALLALKYVVGRRLREYAKKTETDIDDVVAEVLDRTRVYFMLALSLCAGSYALVLPDRVDAVLRSFAILALLAQAAGWTGQIAVYALQRWVERRSGADPSTRTRIEALGFFGKLAIWSIAALLALDNLGFEVTTLVAGLGITGVAVALAVQNILGDLFSSVSIILDQPFVLGDTIVVDNLTGTVERIGLKTTRLRSLSGEQLVFSNSDLLKSRIHNFKRMEERRIAFNVGVVYETPYDKLKAIPDMLREIVEGLPDTRFDRAHFFSYGESSLNFEVVYFVTAPDQRLYMDRQQAINLEIFRRFHEQGIEFAYPARMVLLPGGKADVAGAGPAGAGPAGAAGADRVRPV